MVKAVVQNSSDEDGDGLFSPGFEAAEKSKVRTARLRRAWASRGIAQVCLAILAAHAAWAIGQTRYVDATPTPGSFPIAKAAIYVDSTDWPGVIRAATDLQSDIARVTGHTPALAAEPAGAVIIAGTIGKSPTIDRLIREGKLNAGAIAGKWEASVTQVVGDSLVIAGSDKRGAIYGIYDLSEQIGVSPWYWWADVPVRHQNALYVKAGRYEQGSPAVKYRGIFLNDEAPSLTGWTKEKFGGYNHQFYEKVFELILRMKGNFLWPAMWGSAFNEDDPLNPKLADEYGIVMSTSHHEPMLRAQQEWKRHGQGPWDYSRNGDFLRQFWSEGVERNRNYESIITLAMRGDGDMPMAGNPADNVSLLEKIVADQRKIIAEKVNPDVAKVPQVWALYKEVQGYYETGMRVPDDVTLLWSDDNWGNVRRLPTADERKRAGGAGIYYHFDYVGGPRNYKWLNTVPITKVWEQMSMAWQYGADRIWVVNVGDLKPMEFPIEFFLHLAWNPQAWPKDRIAEYTRLWAEREFGAEFAPRVASLITKYTKYNGRRKPELIDPSTYSLTDYQEADRIVSEWRTLSDEAEETYYALPAEYRDAFFQLVLYPVKASAQVTALYIAAGRNKLYAAQGRASANDLANEVRLLFQADSDLSARYNHELAGGKWNHMMDQTHIGYTYWQEPRQNNVPAVQEIGLPEGAGMGIAIEGSASAWPGGEGDPALPLYDVFTRRRHYIDVFNRGREPFQFTATSSGQWIDLSITSGTVVTEKRIWVSVDWRAAQEGKGEGVVTITGPAGQTVAVRVQSVYPQEPLRDLVDGFVESTGVVSMEAEHFRKRVDKPAAHWDVVPDYGRTLSSLATFPSNAPSIETPEQAPCLEYQMFLFDTGKAEVDTILAPTLNFVPGRGLRYAIAFDDDKPQIVDALAHNTQRDWEATVKDSVRHVLSTHTIAEPGVHTLKIWMVDPGLVLQKVVVNMGGLKPSYLGPPESYFRLP
jgi:hypothetical protein